jgi:hypothetical protein
MAIHFFLLSRYYSYSILATKQEDGSVVMQEPKPQFEHCATDAIAFHHVPPQWMVYADDLWHGCATSVD